MQITLEIPDEMAGDLADGPGAVTRLAMESLAVEGYRSGRLSSFQVRQMLGHASRWETEDFLSTHGAWPGITEADLAEEFRSLDHQRPA